MGLDMYLTGQKRFIRQNPQRGDRKGESYDLGIWRKHPNLHGFIVEKIADGRDECQEIDLSSDDLRAILHAVEARLLPETTGFFFGESPDTPEQFAEDMALFRDALAWLETEEPGVWRTVTYRASW